MNAPDVLFYAHGEVQRAIAAVPPGQENVPGVVGVWSAKDVIAHLTSFEEVLIDVLRSELEGGSTLMLDRYVDPGGAFNGREVAARASMTWPEVVAAFGRAAEQTSALAGRISLDRWREPGSIPWYGEPYSLDDLVVYAFYGHAREHCAEIALFVDHLAA